MLFYEKTRARLQGMSAKTINIITVVLVVVIIAAQAWAARANCAKTNGEWMGALGCSKESIAMVNCANVHDDESRVVLGCWDHDFGDLFSADR